MKCTRRSVYYISTLRLCAPEVRPIPVLYRCAKAPARFIGIFCAHIISPEPWEWYSSKRCSPSVRFALGGAHTIDGLRTQSRKKHQTRTNECALPFLSL